MGFDKRRLRKRAGALGFRVGPPVCFDRDSLPPIPVDLGRGGLARGPRRSTRRTGTGSPPSPRTPDEPSGAGVVILPDVRGLYRFYEELALRFAERGYAAIAFDYFGRTAGVAKRDDEFEYMPHVAADDRRGRPGRHARGGRAWLRGAGARGSSPSASASAGATRGWPRPAATVSPARSASTAARVRADGSPGPDPARPEMEAPILGAEAGADQNIPAEDDAAFERALEDAGRRARARHLRGAPHSFFDRKQEDFADASEEPGGACSLHRAAP